MKNNQYLRICIFFLLFFLYLEILFHFTTFQSLSWNLIYLIFLTLPIAGFFYLMANLGNRIVNHVVSYVLLVFFTILFGAQFVYFEIYQSLFSIYSMVHGGQAFQFLDKILEVIFSRWWFFILLLLPLIVFIILDLCHFFDYHRISMKKKGFFLLSLICFHFGTVVSMQLWMTSGIYSNRHLYHDVHVPLLTADHFGNTTMLRLDLKRFLFGFTEKDLNIEEPSPSSDPLPEEGEKYNVLEIDWEKVIEQETNEKIKSIHQYFASQSPTLQNEYTGKFKGKNLIVFVAEAFSPLAIDKELTPTLYKLYEEGFQFTNFYTPLFPVSTADGEYMTDTSLIPKEGVWSVYRVKDNYMPFSYANQFKKLGYTTQSYHNNTYTYYKRNDYMKAMGFDRYTACGNGLEKKINCKIWPQSDLEMIEATTEDYLSKEHFLTYYMTVSGHLQYTKLGNMMVTKNWNLVKNLNLSDKAKSYLAANIEFDRALEELLKRLKETGHLNDTVISITGDHYPYGLELDEINELSTYKRDKDFEIHRMPFLLWSNDLNGPIPVEKVGSSLDVVPTLYNLFGISYDSRLLMGRDLLSDSEPVVVFANRSFITDKGRFNTVGRKYTGEKLDDEEEYIQRISAIVYNKFKYSSMVLEEDYYRKLYQRLGWD